MFVFKQEIRAGLEFIPSVPSKKLYSPADSQPERSLFLDALNYRKTNWIFMFTIRESKGWVGCKSWGT